MKQGSKEWLQWRHEGIGGSDVSAIMGVSRFKTVLELYKEKIKESPPEAGDKFIFEKGHKLEDAARSKYELETFKDWKPILVEHKTRKRFRVSLDGYNDELEAVWECKYLSLEKFNNLKNEKLSVEQRIPAEYWPQLMYQVFVSGADRIHFTGIVDGHVLKTLEKGETEISTLVFEITAAYWRYINDELIPAVNLFLKNVDNRTAPDISKSDFVEMKDPVFHTLLKEYWKAKEQAVKFATKEKELKKQIFRKTLAIHTCVRNKDFTIVESTSEDKEVLDYERYVIENEIEIKSLGYVIMKRGRKMQKITQKKK